MVPNVAESGGVEFAFSAQIAFEHLDGVFGRQPGWRNAIEKSSTIELLNRSNVASISVPFEVPPLAQLNQLALDVLG